MKINFIGALCAFFYVSTAAAADMQRDDALDEIILLFADATRAWEPVIQDLTYSLFSGLVIISFTWTFIEMLLKDAGLVDVVAELARRVLQIGFSVFLIENAADLARALLDSFAEIATRASNSIAFSPANVFDLSVDVISIVLEKTSIFEPAASLMLFLIAFAVLVCFALIALDMTVLLISSFVIVSGGIVAMGLLGSEWTRDHAINYFTTVLGIAFKLFVMQLVFSIGYDFIHDWGNSISETSESTDHLVMLGVVIVYAGMMREIPQMAASLASGRFTMSGGGIQASVVGLGAVAQAGMDFAQSSDSSLGSPSQSNDESVAAHHFDTGDSALAFSHSSYDEPVAAHHFDTGDSAPAFSHSSIDRDNDHAKDFDEASSRFASKEKEAGAGQSAVGRALAEGARNLGEKPIEDLTKASDEDIRRHLKAETAMK